jgi:hypothetical protein
MADDSKRRPRQENNVIRKTLLLAVGLAAVTSATIVPVSAAPPNVSARVEDATLRIAGSPFADTIALRLSATDRNQLQVDVGDDGSADATFDPSTFRAIDVEAGNGADTVRIDDVNGAFTTTKPTQIAGGTGNDTLIGGSGAEAFFGGNGDDFVDGNGGADTAFLGRGADTFVWDPGDASDIVEGGNGQDAMVFNGSGGNEIMAATAHGGRVSFTRNLGTIVMDLDDVEVIDVRALGGTDTVTVDDARGTDLERVDVDLAAALGGSTADGAADTVTSVATTGDDSIAVDANGATVAVSGLAADVRITHADASRDTLIVDTVAGSDKVALDPAVTGLIQVSVK